MENDARYAFGLFLTKHSIQVIQWHNNKAWLRNKHGFVYGKNISDIIPFVVKPFDDDTLFGRVGLVYSVSQPKAYFKIHYTIGGQITGLGRDESTKMFFEHFEWGDVCQILKL